MKEGFKTDSDVLIEIAEEEGLSMREVRDLWKHQKNYIKKLMEQDDVYSIRIPFIGTYCLNVKQAKKEKERRKDDLYHKFYDKIEKLLDHPNFNYFKNAHKRVTGVNRLARVIVRHYDTEVKKPRRLMPHKKCWKIIENYSNGNYQLKTKKVDIEDEDV